jgi:hypothetical protein
MHPAVMWSIFYYGISVIIVAVIVITATVISIAAVNIIINCMMSSDLREWPRTMKLKRQGEWACVCFKIGLLFKN